jgi:hypothetical protein
MNLPRKISPQRNIKKEKRLSPSKSNSKSSPHKNENTKELDENFWKDCDE